MIDREHELPVKRQAELLRLSRSGLYYRPRPVPEADLVVMRRLDELHLEAPFAGSRMLRGLLLANGIAISLDGRGAWRDNVFVERLWRSVKYEEVYLRAYDGVATRAPRSAGT